MTNCSNAQARERIRRSIPPCRRSKKCWRHGRADPDKFREIERRVSQYLPAVLEQAKREEPQTAVMLERFDDLWCKLRSGLNVAEIKDKRR